MISQCVVHVTYCTVPIGRFDLFFCVVVTWPSLDASPFAREKGLGTVASKACSALSANVGQFNK